MDEEIKGYFRADLTRRLGFNINYALLFTPTRLVAAKVSSQKKQLIGWVIGGVVGYHLFGRHDVDKRAKQMSKASVESILKADKDNFEIHYSDISRVEMSKPTLGARLMTDTGRLAGTIKITSETERKFNIVSGENFEECVNLVRSVLPDKLTVK